jgi:SDR family mycofactocin-dependent oxidoreductase
MGRFDGMVVLVTGAARGQGRAHCVRFAAEGADVVALDVCRSLSDKITYAPATMADLQETAELVRGKGGRIVTAEVDVRDYSALREAVDAAVAQFGPVRVAIANAGVISYARLDNLAEEEWDVVVDTNLKGSWNTIRAITPSMIEAGQGGSIILISSTAGIRGQLPYAHYVASKWGVVGLMRAAANELGREGIRVNAVNPGAVRTQMGEDPSIPTVVALEPLMHVPGGTVLDTSRYPDSVPGDGRMQPGDISDAVLFLASEQARYITGTTMIVDAGQTNRP